MVPKKALGFVQLGVRFPVDTEPNDRGQLNGDCPFCGKKKHFGINVKTLLWNCKRCSREGNFEQFMADRVEAFSADLKGKTLSDLCKSRGLSPKTLRRWEVGWIAHSNLYSIPVRIGPRVVGVHRYDMTDKKMLSTTGGCAGFLRASDLSLGEGGTTVWICEGEWDAMALDEVVRLTKRKDLAAVGICGASGLSAKLAQKFQDVKVTLALDNDEPGEKGTARAIKHLSGIAESVGIVAWPPGREKGYDVRDMRSEYPTKPNTFLKELENLVVDAGGNHPAASTGQVVAGLPASAFVSTTPTEPTGDGMDRADVIKEYRKWLYLPDSDVLDVLYGAIFANRLDGDPLWLFLVGPPGCGKTELIVSLSKAPLMFPITTFTPAALISGQQNVGMNDPSLIPLWNRRVVAVEDFTTILQMNPLAKDEIFGILRSAYGGTIEKRYGTGVHRKYKSRFGLVAGVTPKIEEYGPEHTVVGERFIKYYMRTPGILDRGAKVIERVVANLGRQSDMQRELKDVARRALDVAVDRESAPQIGKSVAGKFVRLAQWTANLRGIVPRDRYKDDKIIFKPTAELGTRVAKQFCKLAQGIAIFRGNERVGLDEYRIIARIARDSAPDLVELFVGTMYTKRRDGWITTGELVKWTRYPQTTVEGVLKNLAMLRLVQKGGRVGYASGGEQWRLAASFLRMMRDLNLYSDERRYRRLKAERLELVGKAKPKAKRKPKAKKKAKAKGKKR